MFSYQYFAAVLAPRSSITNHAPMVIGYHCIFGMYGFWLPNDPRGSGSDYIASWELFRYGPATRIHTKRSVAARPHDEAARQAAKDALRFPPVKLTGKQALVVARGFAWAAEEGEYAIHGCAVLPDHVHLVIGRHSRKIRMIVGHLKSRATRLLRLRGPWHDDDRPMWGEHGWNVYLNDAESVNMQSSTCGTTRRRKASPCKTGRSSTHSIPRWRWPQCGARARCKHRGEIIETCERKKTARDWICSCPGLSVPSVSRQPRGTIVTNVVSLFSTVQVRRVLDAKRVASNAAK